MHAQRSRVVTGTEPDWVLCAKWSHARLLEQVSNKNKTDEGQQFHCMTTTTARQRISDFGIYLKNEERFAVVVGNT